MSGYATCPACLRTHFECVCSRACGVCGIVTNHTTESHERVLAEQERGDEEDEE